MKTIISGVMSGVNKTESGMKINAKFGYTGFSNRIVLSPEIIGTTNTVLIGMGNIVADEYFKNK
jgi:hypothetical protein